jgi:hypothetical protein
MDTALPASPAWLRLAKRYIWWQTPEESLRTSHRLIAQVMNLGTLEDLAALRELVDDDTLRQALAEANPGEFSDRSWHFWHQVLGGPGLVDVPPLPERQFA